MTVSEKIAAGFYTAAYPAGVNRKTPEGQALVEAYRVEQYKKMAQFKVDLEEENGLVGHPKADRLYAQAYEMGHSGGLSEILYYYDELSELLS